MRSKAFRRRLEAASAAARRRAAMERAEAHRVHIEWALNEPGLNGKRITFNGAGEKLNQLEIPSPMGGRWTSENVADIAVRLKLREKPVRVPREVLQTQVAAIWKRLPNCTGQQVVEMLKPQYPICIARAWRFLRNCREVAASRSRFQQPPSWRLDPRTAARIAIGEMWSRHPELTAKQIIQCLGPKFSLPLQWVQKMLRECWRASAKRSTEQRRVGRRNPRARRSGAARSHGRATGRP
jgi:hypothetical protein